MSWVWYQVSNYMNDRAQFTLIGFAGNTKLGQLEENRIAGQK